jgi:endonuclease YncB( thermonuclease family)
MWDGEPLAAQLPDRRKQFPHNVQPGLTPDPSPVPSRQYRVAERAAKTGQVRIWRGWTPQTVSGTREYQGTVIEVVSGDTVVIKVDVDGSPIGEERRVSLSSLRAPRQVMKRRALS